MTMTIPSRLSPLIISSHSRSARLLSKKQKPIPTQTKPKTETPTLTATPTQPQLPPPHRHPACLYGTPSIHRRGVTDSLKISGYSYIYVRVQKDMTRTPHTALLIAAMSIVDVVVNTATVQANPGPSQLSAFLPPAHFVRRGREEGFPHPVGGGNTFPTPTQRPPEAGCK